MYNFLPPGALIFAISHSVIPDEIAELALALPLNAFNSPDLDGLCLLLLFMSCNHFSINSLHECLPQNRAHCSARN